MFCKECGKDIKDNAAICIHCGVATGSAQNTQVNVNIGGEETSDKEWLVTLLLCFFGGGIGIHRFYTGHTGVGVAQLLTLGGCGIWVLIDLIMILTGSFTDAQGRPLKK